MLGHVYKFRKRMTERKKAEKATSVRLEADELERLNALVAHVKKRNPTITITWVVRELLGLTNVQLLTEEERESFRAGAGLEAPLPQVPEPVRRRA